MTNEGNGMKKNLAEQIEGIRRWLLEYENRWSQTVTELKANIKSLSVKNNEHTQNIDNLRRSSARIVEQLVKIIERAAEVEGRLKTLGSQTEFETSEDDTRLRDLETRMRDIERRLGTVAYRDWKHMAERVANLERMAGPPPRPITDEELKEARDAAVQSMRSGRVTFVPDAAMAGIDYGYMVSPEAGVLEHKTSGDGPEGTVIGRGVVPSCSEAGHDHTTSSCLGPKDAVDRLIAEGPFKPGDVIPAWINSSAAINTIRAALMSPSAPRTRAMAIQAAERRVFNYMNGHFSTASIDGVLAAVRGDRVAPEDHPELDLPQRQPMDMGIQVAERAPNDRV